LPFDPPTSVSRQGPLLLPDSLSTQLYSYPNLSVLFRIKAAIGGCFCIRFRVSSIFDGAGGIAADEAWLCRVSSSR